MIKEAYCSHEVSELLKEKGFDESIHTWYNLEDGEYKFIEGCIKISNVDFVANDEDCCSAPTHQMAMAWLREKHNILIIPRWIYDNNNSTIVYGYAIFKVFPLPYKNYSSGPIWYIEYEEAMEAALKYSLENLI